MDKILLERTSVKQNYGKEDSDVHYGREGVLESKDSVRGDQEALKVEVLAIMMRVWTTIR